MATASAFSHAHIPSQSPVRCQATTIARKLRVASANVAPRRVAPVAAIVHIVLVDLIDGA